MIELRGVSKTYNEGKDDEVKALKDVNLTFDDSGLYFITGKSGSGKSTLLNLLGGLDEVSQGEIVFNGISLSGFTPLQWDEYRKDNVGFIFQGFNLIDELSVGENVALALDLKGEENFDGRVSEALKQVDLEGYEKRKSSKLSGGQKQRVAIARALIKSPNVILADEPTGNLDSKTGQTIFDLLKEISKERLVIAVSHDEESVKKYADVVIECVDGEISVIDNRQERKEPLVNAQDEAESVAQGEVENVCEGEMTKTAKADSKPKKMNARSIFKLGLGFAKRHKWRMIVTLILFVFALSFMGLAVAMAECNDASVEYACLVDKGEEVVHLVSMINPDADISGGGLNHMMTNEQADKICSALPNFQFGKIYKDDEMERTLLSNYLPELSSDDRYYPTDASGYCCLTQEDLARFGFKLAGGRLPEMRFEIALTKYTAETFLEYGLYNAETDEWEMLPDGSDVTDLIGKKLEYYQGHRYDIVGIIDTGFDFSMFQDVRHYPTEMTQKQYERYSDLAEQLEIIKTYSVHNALFVSSDYLVVYYYTGPTAVAKCSEYYSFPIGAYAYGDTWRDYRISWIKENKELADDEIIIESTIAEAIRALDSSSSSSQDLVDYFATKKLTLRLASDLGEPYSEPKEFKVAGILEWGYRPYYIDYGDTFVPMMLMSESLLSDYYYSDEVIWSLFTPLSGNKKSDMKLVRLAHNYNLDDEYYFPIMWWMWKQLEFSYIVISFFKYFGLITSVIFFIFTLLMITNYIGSTISSSKKQIGILKSLGAGNKELISVFSVEAALLAAIGFILAICLTAAFVAGVSFLLNYVTNIVSGMGVDWLTGLCLLVLAGAACALGSILPIKKLLKKKPIDIING